MNFTIHITSVEDARQAQAMLRAYIITQDCAPKDPHDIGEDMPLSYLELPGRPYNCLIADGITTVEALCRTRSHDLLKLPNLGLGALTDIKNALAAKGLTLAD